MSHGMRSTSAGVSVAIHLGAVALMSIIGAHVAQTRFEKPIRILIPLHAPRLMRAPAGGGGGGGTSDSLPARQGSLPPPQVARVFVPPSLEVANPKLPVSVAMIDAPDIQMTMDHYGDPLGKSGIASGGPGHGGGFGDSCCGGVGPGKGNRYGPGDGGPGGGPVLSRVSYSAMPKLIYKIEPEYPDEARKARFEGTVVLSVEVDSKGQPHLVRVVRGLGLGLDERAVEAVNKWRFTPAIASGKPVAAPVVIEVSFRLL